MRFTHLGILAFVAAVVAGPLYTVTGYSAVRNLISELSAQNTPGNWIMSAAFLTLGAGIVADGTRSFAFHQLPFIAFGVFMALAGIFSHKPIDLQLTYVEWEHTAHSALATAAGVSVTVGFVWQAVHLQMPLHRLLVAVLALMCVVLPLAMFRFPEVQGVVQRVMYALVFMWLWSFYPRDTHG